MLIEGGPQGFEPDVSLNVLWMRVEELSEMLRIDAERLQAALVDYQQEKLRIAMSQLEPPAN